MRCIFGWASHDMIMILNQFLAPVTVSVKQETSEEISQLEGSLLWSCGLIIVKYFESMKAQSMFYHFVSWVQKSQAETKNKLGFFFIKKNVYRELLIGCSLYSDTSHLCSTQCWIKPGLVDVHSSKYTKIQSEIVFGKKKTWYLTLLPLYLFSLLGNRDLIQMDLGWMCVCKCACVSAEVRSCW